MMRRHSERLRNHGSAARQAPKGRDIRRQPSAACRADVIANFLLPRQRHNLFGLTPQSFLYLLASTLLNPL